MTRGRRPSDDTLRLRAVPCDLHGDVPCPRRHACKNRRERAGLAPLLGKREARRMASSQAAAWVRASLDVGAEIAGRDGKALDPESHDWEMIRDALDELLGELQVRAEK